MTRIRYDLVFCTARIITFREGQPCSTEIAKLCLAPVGRGFSELTLSIEAIVVSNYLGISNHDGKGLVLLPFQKKK